MKPSNGKYGCWGGNPGGVKEDPKKCVEQVWPDNGFIPRQCSRKRGYGPSGEYCHQHANQQGES